MIKINESPRDAMQAFKKCISLEEKIEYVNLLLKVGFDIVDIGSFVSSKAVPQMKDTDKLLENIGMKDNNSKISVLAGNTFFAEKLAGYENVDYINYAFGISEKFQRKNLNAGFEKSLRTVDDIINICERTNKKPIISISEAFGNPYGDDWGIDILMEWIELFYERGLRYIPLADTTASGSAHLIGLIFDNIIREYDDVEFNFHLHTVSDETIDKIEAAYNAGCRNFDTVFNGMGGCPMTGEKPVANLNTVVFIDWLNENHIEHKIKNSLFNDAVNKAVSIFS